MPAPRCSGYRDLVDTRAGRSPRGSGSSHVGRSLREPFDARVAAMATAPKGLPSIGRGHDEPSVGDAVGTLSRWQSRGVAGGTGVVAYLFQQGHLVGWATDLPHGRPGQGDQRRRAGLATTSPRTIGDWGRQLGAPPDLTLTITRAGNPRYLDWGFGSAAPGDASPGTGHHRLEQDNPRAPLPTTRCYQWLRPTLVSSG